MRGTISKYTLSNIYYLLVLLMLAISSYITMPDTDNTADIGTGLSALVMAGLAIIQIPLLFHIFRERVKGVVKMPRFVVLYGVYICWMTAITLSMDSAHNIKGLIVVSMTLFVFIFMLITSYYRSRYSELNIWFFMGVLFVLGCITLQYFNIYSLANQVGTDKSHIAVSYFPLFILPVLLLPSSRLVRYASIAITSIIIISSIKRGGVIALGISLMAYAFVKQWVSGRSMMKQWIYISIVILLMGGVIYILSQQEDNNVIERIMNISNDGGSDRDVLWEDTYNNIQDRDFVSRIIGNGYRSSQKASKYFLMSHNDILEIWYDFGGVGIILYGIAFISLSLYFLRLLKRKSKYTPHLAMTLTFYIILSMISTVILYFWMTLFMFTVGIIAGLADRELEESEEQKHTLSNSKNS